MADYPLSITGAEIDSALGKVHGADTTPTNGSSDMVTSGGVFTAINNLDVTNIAASALVTESEGITNNDNDSSIPTSAAVKDFVDTFGTKVAQLTAPNGSTIESLTIPFTVSSDPSSIVSVSNGVATPTSSGVYQVAIEGEFSEDDNDTGERFVLQLFLHKTDRAININETGFNVFEFKNVISFINADTTYFLFFRGNSSQAYHIETLTIVKIA